LLLAQAWLARRFLFNWVGSSETVAKVGKLLRSQPASSFLPRLSTRAEQELLAVDHARSSGNPGQSA
jgi:hypothetical protein